MPSDGEIALIARWFAPLATHPAARGLKDDAALLENEPRLVLTQDTIVEGVHFLPDDPIDTVARKALRVNVSDLTAKGATLLGVLVSLQWPAGRPVEEVGRFAQGLGADLAHYGGALLGGDTTATPGPLAITITALGRPLGPRTPDRAGAQAGDDLWLTGPIGDGWLGLLAAQGRLAIDASDADALAARYRVPDPPVCHAALIAEVATASLDVSDGLILDLSRLAAASGVMAVLDLAAVPLSPEAGRWLDGESDRAAALERLCAGGDDYQTLMAATPVSRGRLAATPGLVRIGRIEAGEGVWLVDGTSGTRRPPAFRGYEHRWLVQSGER